MSQANALHEVPFDFQDGVSAARLVPYSRSWYIAKIILRAVSLLLCIVIFILAVVSVDTYRGYDLSWASCVPPALAAALYDIASFVVVCVRRAKKRGIHPGIDVAADLIIWLTCGIGATWVPAGGVTVNAAGYMSGADIAMMIFLYVLLVFHFVLFCRDCHETRQRNKSRPFEKFVYIPGGGKPFPVLVPAAHGHAAPQPQPVAVVDPEPAVPETDAYGPPPEPEDIDLSYSQGSIQKEIIPEDFYPHNRR